MIFPNLMISARTIDPYSTPIPKLKSGIYVS